MSNAITYALTEDMKSYLLPAMIQTFGDKCAICQQRKPSYVIDHLKYGDTVTMYDLQLLCAGCHKAKSLASGEAYLTRTPHCATCTCYA